MPNYHINQKTGNANICRAKDGNCPLKDADGCQQQAVFVILKNKLL